MSQATPPQSAPPVELCIAVLSGPAAGRRTTLNQPVIPFGRESTNLLVLSDPTASRRHGEIRREGDQWVLVNLSPNGTKVNRRRVDQKPAVLGDGDVVSVGDTPVFQVFLKPPAADDDDSGASPAIAAAAQAQNPVSKRKKLMTVLGIWWGLMVVVGLFLFVVFNFGDPGTGPAKEVKRLTEDEIAWAISSPPSRSTGPLDMNEARRLLSQAQELRVQALGNPQDSKLLYEAFRKYRDALVAARLEAFGQARRNPAPGEPTEGLGGPEDQVAFIKDIREPLIKAVQQAYAKALAERLSPERANRAFDAVRELYPERDSIIYLNILDHMEDMRKRMPKKDSIF